MVCTTSRAASGDELDMQKCNIAKFHWHWDIAARAEQVKPHCSKRSVQEQWGRGLIEPVDQVQEHTARNRTVSDRRPTPSPGRLDPLVIPVSTYGHGGQQPSASVALESTLEVSDVPDGESPAQAACRLPDRQPCVQAPCAVSPRSGGGSQAVKSAARRLWPSSRSSGSRSSRRNRRDTVWRALHT